ncbi:hypothetical protein HDU76_000910 [Blyttiomyces sp. JEL0837]|nr:hypothetical protein HDU76_000910 [Blyttiomyces sp. JEL0837]
MISLVGVIHCIITLGADTSLSIIDWTSEAFKPSPVLQNVFESIEMSDSITAQPSVDHPVEEGAVVVPQIGSEDVAPQTEMAISAEETPDNAAPRAELAESVGENARQESTNLDRSFIFLGYRNQSPANTLVERSVQADGTIQLARYADSRPRIVESIVAHQLFNSGKALSIDIFANGVVAQNSAVFNSLNNYEGYIAFIIPIDSGFWQITDIGVVSPNNYIIVDEKLGLPIPTGRSLFRTPMGSGLHRVPIILDTHPAGLTCFSGIGAYNAAQIVGISEITEKARLIFIDRPLYEPLDAELSLRGLNCTAFFTFCKAEGANVEIPLGSTFLCPSDDAFLNAELYLQQLSREDIQSLFLCHLVKGEHFVHTLKDGDMLETSLSSESLTVLIDGGRLGVSTDPLDVADVLEEYIFDRGTLMLISNIVLPSHLRDKLSILMTMAVAVHPSRDETAPIAAAFEENVNDRGVALEEEEVAGNVDNNNNPIDLDSDVSDDDSADTIDLDSDNSIDDLRIDLPASSTSTVNDHSASTNAPDANAHVVSNQPIMARSLLTLREAMKEFQCEMFFAICAARAVGLGQRSGCTFLMPTNEAYHRVKAELKGPKGGELQMIMSRHVVPRVYFAKDLKSGVILTSESGDNLKVTRTENELLLSTEFEMTTVTVTVVNEREVEGGNLLVVSQVLFFPESPETAAPVPPAATSQQAPASSVYVDAPSLSSASNLSGDDPSPPSGFSFGERFGVKVGEVPTFGAPSDKTRPSGGFSFGLYSGQAGTSPSATPLATTTNTTGASTQPRSLGSANGAVPHLSSGNGSSPPVAPINQEAIAIGPKVGQSSDQTKESARTNSVPSTLPKTESSVSSYDWSQLFGGSSTSKHSFGGAAATVTEVEQEKVRPRDGGLLSGGNAASNHTFGGGSTPLVEMEHKRNSAANLGASSLPEDAPVPRDFGHLFGGITASNLAERGGAAALPKKDAPEEVVDLAPAAEPVSSLGDGESAKKLPNNSDYLSELQVRIHQLEEQLRAERHARKVAEVMVVKLMAENVELENEVVSLQEKNAVLMNTRPPHPSGIPLPGKSIAGSEPVAAAVDSDVKCLSQETKVAKESKSTPETVKTFKLTVPDVSAGEKKAFAKVKTAPAGCKPNTTSVPRAKVATADLGAGESTLESTVSPKINTPPPRNGNIPKTQPIRNNSNPGIIGHNPKVAKGDLGSRKMAVESTLPKPKSLPNCNTNNHSTSGPKTPNASTSTAPPSRMATARKMAAQANREEARKYASTHKAK